MGNEEGERPLPGKKVIGQGLSELTGDESFAKMGS